MKNVVVLVNPAAGGGRGGRRWRRLCKAVPEVKGARVLEPDGAESSRADLAAVLREGGVERVIVVGGDGTAHLAANVLLELPREERPAFGLVPAGTGSDLARGLGLSRRPAAALRQALTGPPRPMDAISLEADDGRRRFVLNIGSGGLSGAVVLAISANPRRGPLSYMISTVTGLLGYDPAPCRVVAAGEELYDGAVFLVAVANGRYFGKGMKVAPDATTDDGLLDVIIVPPVARYKLPYRLPQFFTGSYVQMDQVTVRKVERVRLEPGAGFPPFELDGESFDAGAVEFRVLPGALHVVV